MTYELRRLRLHGLIERILNTHRFRVTDFGLRAALFFTRAYVRLVRAGLSEVLPTLPAAAARPNLQACFNRLEKAMDD